MLKRAFSFLLSIGLLLFISGCETLDDPEVGAEAFYLQESEVVSVGVDNKLMPGDAVDLSVEVDGRLEVASHRGVINSQGIATFPLIGDVKIGGFTLGAARGTISKAYSAFFVRSPVIMINTVGEQDEGEWGFVTVTGRVGRPGRVRIPSSKGIKLTTAIQESGGFAGSAKKSEVRISRTNPEGRKLRVSVNYNTIGQDGNVDADVDLKDGDIVYVPERIF